MAVVKCVVQRTKRSALLYNFIFLIFFLTQRSSSVPVAMQLSLIESLVF